MTRVTAAAVQLSPVLYSREGTIDKVVGRSPTSDGGACSSPPSRRRWFPYYPYFSFIQPPFKIIGGREHLRLLEQAVTVPSDATAAIGDAARQAGVVVSIGVNERDGGTLYNTQLLFDADGTPDSAAPQDVPTYHERMVWGQGDGSGLRAVDSAVGRIGQLACWEHYNPLARYAMMADGEQIHSAMYPGSIAGDLFAGQTGSTSASTRWSPPASWSTPPPGWTPSNRRRSCGTLGAAIGPIRVGASPRSSPRKANCSASHCVPAKAWSSPTWISR